MENPLMSGLSKIINSIFLSLLWVLFCLPIVTIGAATTALYYTVNKTIQNERGYLWNQFWHAFKTNFKQATILWIIFAGIALVFYNDVQIIKLIEDGGGIPSGLHVFFYIVIALEGFLLMYIFPYIGRFNTTLKIIVKNSVLISILNLPKTIMMGAICFMGVLIIWLIPLTVFIMPTVTMWLVSYVMEKIFIRYMSEEDKSIEEKRNNI